MRMTDPYAIATQLQTRQRVLCPIKLAFFDVGDLVLHEV